VIRGNTVTHRSGKADSVDPARSTYSIVPLGQIGTRS